MSFWRRDGSEAQPPQAAGAADSAPSGEPAPPADETPGVAGERGIPSVNRIRSVQSRVSSVLTIALMSSLAAGLLIWYYSGAIHRNDHAQELAAAKQKRRAQGDTSLPPLGVIPPEERAAPAHQSTVEQILGSPPPTYAPEMPVATTNPYAAANPYAPQGPYASAAPPPKTPAQLALERQLAGPVLARIPSQDRSGGEPAEGEGGTALSGPVSVTPLAAGEPHERSEADGDRGLAALLRPTATPAVSARVLPTQRFLLPKGAFIDCTLETAINSALPGMTTCITATDTFSADGTVVLLERGTKLVGETRGQIQQGSPRLFVLWTEARTPTGVVVPLASPGTDELGRSGLTGTIDWHWWQRFGAAILITVIDGAVQGFSQSRSGNGSSFVFEPSTSSDVMSEVLRNTLAIAPTIDKPQGDRLQVLVARDVDFRSVYSLRAAAAGEP